MLSRCLVPFFLFLLLSTISSSSLSSPSAPSPRQAIFAIMDPHAGTGRVVLPTNVRPTHYDLTLSPDLVDFTFHGHVLINLDVNLPTTAITLNSNQLTIVSAKLTNLALKTESRYVSLILVE